MPSSQFDSENEQYDEEVVTLVDEYNRSLDCYIEHSLESEGTTYILLLPVDSPVVIMAWDEEEEEEEVPEAVLIEEKEEIEEVFDDAKAVLAEQNLILKHTAFTLTVSGELPPIEDDKVLTLEFLS
jgi:superfamily II helicase